VLGIMLAWRFIPDIREDVAPLDWIGFALSGFGLALAMFGFSTLGRHMVSLPVAAACLAAGLAALAGYLVHARRHPHPLLDLGLFRIPTFRAGVLGGGVFRIGIGAIPFLLPLMLQLGFGLNPLQSGLVTFASAAGAMFMKTIAARVLKRFGFRGVLFWNALVCSSLLAGYGLFRATTPHLLMIGVLLVAGCFRSLQFTSLNAISFADVEPRAMSQASSLSGMMQQLSLSLGVAVAGYALQLAGWFHGTDPTAVGNFAPAFAMVAAIGALSAWMMWALPGDAGHEMAGRAHAGREISEPKVEQRPAT
jgi:hypothetical protein